MFARAYSVRTHLFFAKYVYRAMYLEKRFHPDS